MHRRRPVVACPPVIYYADDGEQESFIKNRLLGYGGFAAVYEVERVSDGCRMAAKVLPLSSLADANKLRRVQNEIDINQLLHHPHVVTFLGSFQDEQNVYLLQELCCITLSELLKQVERMTELQAAHILWQVLSALAHLHGCRVAHRDLKLSNMFLAQDGTVKVGDLGLACHLPTPSCRRRSTCGSLNWMAPEVLRPPRHGYGLEVDIWALGVMLFTLLVGRPPFAAVRESTGAEDLLPQTTCGRILQGRYRMPGTNEVLIGPEACDLIARLLSVDPSVRPSLEQLRSHEFFRLHLGALVRPLPGSPFLEWQSGHQESLLQERSVDALEDCVALRTVPSAGEELGLRASSSLQSSISPPPPLATDIRLLLCNQGLAALAASAARIGGSGGACDSTSGSYMELSQSEQCSIVTAASTATTATGGRCGGGGACDPRWQHLCPSNVLSSQLLRSHDPACTRSHTQLPPYRMSEQIVGTISGPQLHGGKGPQPYRKLLERGSVPNSPFKDHSMFCIDAEAGLHGSEPSLSCLTCETSGAFPRGELTGCSSVAPGTFLSVGSPPQNQQLSPSLPSGSQPQLQPYHSHLQQGQHSFQHQHHYLPQAHQQTTFVSARATQPSRLVPVQSAIPFLFTSKNVPGGGADQDLPPSGADVYRAHGLLVAAHSPGHPSPRGGEWPYLDTAGITSDWQAAPLDRQACWMRSCTGLSCHNSAALSTRSTSQHGSAFATSFVHMAIGPQQAQPHPPQLGSHSQRDQQQRYQYDDQGLVREQLVRQQQGSPGQRRRTADSAHLPANPNPRAADPAEAAFEGSNGCGDSRSGADRATGTLTQDMPVLCTAFLSQFNSFRQATAVHARRLQASRSAHARDSMRIAAGMRSVPCGGVLDVGGAEEPENDGSSDTVRSFADSLEAMLLGGQGRQAGGGGGSVTFTRSGPAPVAPSIISRCGQTQTYRSAGNAFTPWQGLAATPAAPSVSATRGPIILRHARSSIGTPSSVRHGRTVYGCNTANVAGCGGVAGALLWQSQGCHAELLPPWPQADGSSIFQSACRVSRASCMLANSELAAASVPACRIDEAKRVCRNSAAACVEAVKSLPVALESPCIPALLPYQGQPSNVLRHSSSAATTPQPSEPLSLAIFAIQQSKGLPNQGLNSPPTGLEGTILDGSLCICAGADSPLWEGVWSGELANVQGRGIEPGLGKRPAGLFAPDARIDLVAAALEAQKAVSNLFEGNNATTLTGTAPAAVVSTSALTVAPACVNREDVAKSGMEKSLSSKECQLSAYQQEGSQQPCEPHEQLLASDVITRVLGIKSKAGGSHVGALSMTPQNWGGHVFAAPGADGTPPIFVPTAERVVLEESLHSRDTSSRQPAGRAYLACSAEMNACANATAMRQELKQGGLAEREFSRGLFMDPGQLIRSEEHQRLQQLAQKEHQDPQRQQQQRHGEVRSGFSFRMHVHPWRAMALARVRQEAMRLHRIQHEEAELEADEDAQPLQEWGDTSSRSAVSAAPLEQTRPQDDEASTRPTICLQGLSTGIRPASAAAPTYCADTSAMRVSGTGAGIPFLKVAAWAPGRVNADCEAASIGSSSGFSVEPYNARHGTGMALVVTASKALPCRVDQATITVAHKFSGPATAEGLPWTASAATAVRGRALSAGAEVHGAPARGTKRGEAPPAASASNVALRNGTAVGRAPLSVRRKPTSSSGWIFDRLGLCCPILPGGCSCVNDPASPNGVTPCYHGGTSHEAHSRREDPGPKRRVASLDVERVLRHLESCDPDDMTVAPPLQSDDAPLELCGTIPYTVGGKGTPMVAVPKDPENLHSALRAEEIDLGQSDLGPTTNGSIPELKDTSWGLLQAQGPFGQNMGGGSGFREGRDTARSVIINLEQVKNDDAITVKAVSNAASKVAPTPAGNSMHGPCFAAGRDDLSSRPYAEGCKRASLEVFLQAWSRAEQVGTTAVIAASTADLVLDAALEASAAAWFGLPSTDGALSTSQQPSQSKMSVPPAQHSTALLLPVSPQSRTSAHPVPKGEGFSDRKTLNLTPSPEVAIAPPLPQSLPAPKTTSSFRVSTSATGMRDNSSVGMGPDPVPEMDPDALAELASRLRSKSFKDGVGSRTGSFTYRPSRMMPAAQRSHTVYGRAVGPVLTTPPAVSGLATDKVSSSDGVGGHAVAIACSETAPGRSRASVHPREVLIVKWLDYSSKYGLSYVLSNGAVGVLFRDGTQLLRDWGDAYAWLLGAPATSASAANKCATVMQSQRLMTEAQPLLLQGEPQAGHQEDPRRYDVSKKIRLLRSFEGMLLGSDVCNNTGSPSDGVSVESHPQPVGQQAGQQDQTLVLNPGAQKADDPAQGTAAALPPPPPGHPPPVFVTWWTHTTKALVLCMSSGTLQALFCDGSELVVKEAEDEVEYLARDGRRTSCSLRAVQQAGTKCSVLKRIEYATMLMKARPGKH